MEVYLNNAETGIGTYGVNAGSQRYFGHDASAMSRLEAARIAAVLPLPKKRGAVSPKGFTRRYGGTIAARIGVVGRDGLDVCVYKGTVPPKDRTPPETRAPRTLPGEEYESARPLPPVENGAAPVEEVTVPVTDPIAVPPQSDPQTLPTENEVAPPPTDPEPLEPSRTGP